MRETAFIEQNKQKWLEFEDALRQQQKDADKLKDVYVQITDDLSYSRTFYPNRSVRVYLNGLAQLVFQAIYKNKKTSFRRFVLFWTDELPQLVLESKNAFLLSFVVFALAFSIGVLSSAMDPEFPRVILGDSYVDMTLENIKSGDPMAVYKQRGELGMSVGITLNNLTVAFRTFVLGVFFSLGTLAIMLYNGIMVGAFQFFFYQQGVFWESFLTIWTHGTLEISAIIIAGAAGATMGSGLLFPGTYTRLQAFLISSRRGLKIMAGIAPIIILAGFIEGFLTRYTETPDVVRLLFILTCLAFVLGYFVWYPFYYKPRVGFKPNPNAYRLPPDATENIRFNEVLTNGEIFSDVFAIYRNELSQTVLVAALSGVLFCLSAFALAGKAPTQVFEFPSTLGILLVESELSQVPILGLVVGVFINLLKTLHQFFDYWNGHWYLFFINVFLMTWGLVASLRIVEFLYQKKLQKRSDARSEKGGFRKMYLKTLPLVALLNLALLLPGRLGGLLFLTLMPIAVLWAFVAIHHQLSLGKAFVKLGQLLTGNLLRFFGLFCLAVFVDVLLLLVLYSPFMWFYYEIIAWNFNLPPEQMAELTVVLLTFVNYFGLMMILPLLYMGIALQSFTLLEMNEAPNLRAAIRQIGERQKLRGMEIE
jgi:uncharacterized membrane protein SpoIIM required for sporulation